MKLTVVYVHGAFISDSQWWWSFVAEKLSPHGIESRAVDLPSCGPEGPLGTLSDDVEAVRKVIAEIATPVVLVGHSYGGAVISAAADGQPNVSHLVYISAVVPAGTSVVECGFIPPDQVPELDIREDGTVSEGPHHFKSRVLDSLPSPEMTEEAVRRLTRQSVASFTEVPSAEAWRTIPSTYVITQFDADVPVSAQRVHAARTGKVYEVPTNHFAHLERPDLVAEILLGIATEHVESSLAGSAPE